MNARIQRTRSSLAAAILQNVAERGSKGLNLTALAKTSGISRATIHNHIRSEKDIHEIIWEAEWARIVPLLSAHTAEKLMFDLATYIAEHQTISGIRAVDPELLVKIHHEVISMPDRISSALSNRLLELNLSSDIVTVETLVRWLTSWMWDPGDAVSRMAGAEIVAAGLRLDARL